MARRGAVPYLTLRAFRKAAITLVSFRVAKMIDVFTG